MSEISKRMEEIDKKSTIGRVPEWKQEDTVWVMKDKGVEAYGLGFRRSTNTDLCARLQYFYYWHSADTRPFLVR